MAWKPQAMISPEREKSDPSGSWTTVPARPVAAVPPRGDETGHPESSEQSPRRPDPLGYTPDHVVKPGGLSLRQTTPSRLHRNAHGGITAAEQPQSCRSGNLQVSRTRPRPLAPPFSRVSQATRGLPLRRLLWVSLRCPRKVTHHGFFFRLVEGVRRCHPTEARSQMGSRLVY